ncbi:MAG: cytidine deaminase [Gammaproteobacteria bacterium]|nr:cytidine deaminase [Gammaproteobacteria bacterium]
MATDDSSLLKRAEAMRDAAHARYSGFRVGAALVDEHGAVHVGCNVEDAAYPLGSCAEANAIAAMVAAGGSKIFRLLVVGGTEEPIACSPCGGCRQRIHEFADSDTRVVYMTDDGEFVERTIAELLPGAFSL